MGPHTSWAPQLARTAPVSTREAARTYACVMRSATVLPFALLLSTLHPAQTEAGSPDQDSAQASRPEPEQEASPQARGLRVFVDCEFGCDFDYLRREITFVNYVRDREDADVHVLVTRRASGGGSEWTLAFLGLEAFAGRDVTLTFDSSSTDTDDEVRERLTQVMRVGLLNYAIETPLAGEIVIRHEPSGSPDAPGVMAVPEDDPWNFWVFRAELSVDAEAQARTAEKSFNAELSASRITDAWKIDLRSDAGYSEDEFEFGDGGILLSYARDWELSGQVVRSLGPHWGASITAAAEASTFQNQDLVVSAAPGVEYSVFPYAESSRRALIVRYEVGYDDVRYDEETIFDVTEETLYDHELLTELAVTQPWGNAFASASISQFLNKTDQYRAEFGGQLDFRVTRGLSVFVRGNYSRVRDQRFIPKEDISDEEVLLRRRALATDFQHEISLGFSYTFGSIFNNVVNPRFGRRGGGGFF